jgi:hypothetical protein
MLHALGIYIQTDVGLEKIKCAQQEKTKPSNAMFFQNEQKPVNQLENIDNALHEQDKESESKFYVTMKPNAVYRRVTTREYDFLYKIKIKSTDTIFAISSKYELSPEEKGFLFTNMQHILIRPDTVKASLDDIIANPQAFTGKDILIGRIQGGNKEIIAIMQKNIDMVIKRGEDLENLKEKAIHLNESAINFEDKAKKLNTCCGW